MTPEQSKLAPTNPSVTPLRKSFPCFCHWPRRAFPSNERQRATCRYFHHLVTTRYCCFEFSREEHMVGFTEEISHAFHLAQLIFEVEHTLVRTLVGVWVSVRASNLHTYLTSVSRTRRLWKECRLSESHNALWDRDCVLKEISPDMVFLYCLCVVSKFPGWILSLKSMKFNLFAWLDGAFWSPTAGAVIVRWIWALAEERKQRPGNSPEGSGSWVCFESAGFKMLEPLTLQISCNKMLVCTEQAGFWVLHVESKGSFTLGSGGHTKPNCFRSARFGFSYVTFAIHTDVLQTKALDLW